MYRKSQRGRYPVGDNKMQRRTVINVAAGVLIGIVVGALVAPFLAALLTDFVWYRFFDLPINTLLVNDPIFVATWLLFIFLGAISGYLLSRG